MNVRFSNGAAIAALGSAAAIAIEGAGSIITNEQGGTITAASGGVAIAGSSGADTVVDAGSIFGETQLGDGADVFEALRSYANQGSVDLGGGDDVFRHRPGTEGQLRNATGGDGFDRLILASYNFVLSGVGISGFEQLEVGLGSNSWNLREFSGFSNIVLEAGSTVALGASSVNDDAAISVLGNSTGRTQITILGSAKSVLGTDGREVIGVDGGKVYQEIKLEGGDDFFHYFDFVSRGTPTLGGVDGGAGTDTLGLMVDDGATVDLADFEGFERLDAGSFSSATSIVRVVNAQGFDTIEVDSLGQLTLADSSLPNTIVNLGTFSSTLVLESSAVVGQIGRRRSDLVQVADTSTSWKIANAGAIIGDVFLFYGSDEFDGAGSVGGSVYGYAGDDRLSGSSQTDRLFGGHGADLLDGKAGPDVMHGGGGDDRYIVDEAADEIHELGAAGTDTVEAPFSFSLPAEVENLILVGPGALSGSGNGSSNSLTGNGAANRLDGGAGSDVLVGGAGDDIYIVDVGSDAVVELADGGFDSVESSSSYVLPIHTERLVLTSGASDGTGNAEANVIVGNSAANRLDGAAGADEMKGGTGNDTFVIDDEGDLVSEADSEGADTVESSISYALGDFVENLILTGTAVSGTGNGRNNVIIGNSVVNVLTGGNGDDLYVVTEAADAVVELAAGGYDTIESSVSYTLPAEVERLTLVATALVATGNGAPNAITGNSAGNTLDGSGGADTLAGLGGDDTYYVDDAGDVVTETDGSGTDIVIATVSYSLAGRFVEHLVLSGSDAQVATGNQLANRLTGNTASNRLDGGSGIDDMAGSGGDDLYIVDHGVDRVTELAGEGTDTIESSVSYVLPAEVERLVLTGSAAAGTGNGGANTITGNAAANWLDGAGGADTMIGGGGNDTFVVNNAGDKAVERAGGGTDTVRSSVNYTLGDEVEHLVLTGSAMSGYGNGLANDMTGNAAANTLDGGAGGDTMRGGAGNDGYYVTRGDKVIELASEGLDRVYSSTDYTLGDNLENLTLTGGADVKGFGNLLGNSLSGNEGNNVLKGGSGADKISGAGGNDKIYGGGGMDILRADAGADGFYFDTGLSSSRNVDEILNFVRADDTIFLLRGVFKGISALGTLNAADFRVGTSAGDASDRIVHDKASGNIYYDADGTGRGGQILFATVDPGVTLTNADFFIYS